MPVYEIVPATEQHIESMLPNVRQADIEEVTAASSRTVEEALHMGLRRSNGYAWAGLADGEVVCIFGVAPMGLLSDTGIPWMIGTPLIEKHSKVFLKRSRRYVKGMCTLYNRLENWVDDRNDCAKDWLAWLGFKLHDPEPYGKKQLPFRRFEMGAE